MNERIKELAEQAGLFWEDIECGNLSQTLERFAELIRDDERESCTKLLYDFSSTRMVPAKDTWRYGVMMAANCVRDKK